MYIHLVFSTKHRHPFITPAVASELFPYMATILYDECKSPAKSIGGVNDHAHSLINLARTISIAELVEHVKTSTSKWIKTKGPEFKDFYWQTGYGAFSVSRSNVAAVERYIRDQEAHRAKQGFQDEFRGLLRKHEVEFDERYVWD